MELLGPVVHIKMGLDTLHYKPTNKKYFVMVEL